MTFAEAIAIAILQGVTELFPISSLGHAVVLPALFDPSIDLKSEAFLPFLVVLHVGTAIALLLFFWRDWFEISIGIFSGGIAPDGEDRRHLLMLLAVATIPAVVLGFAFEKPLRTLFGVPEAAAAFLIANGFLLALAERLRKRSAGAPASSPTLSSVSLLGALGVGLWQCLAFLPGISRSGATIAGGLLAKLSHEQAARFSFLMATPVIAGAAVLEIPKLFHAHASAAAMPNSYIAAGGLAAGVAAYLSVAFLMRYFRTHELSALNPFAVYCIAFGVVSLLVLRF